MRLIILIAILLFAGLLSYQVHTHDQLRFNSLSDRIFHPFDTRLRYQIAPADPRFGLTQAEMIELTRQAADIWQQGTGKQLFIYDPKAQLQIKLVYDERQDNFNAFKKTQESLLQTKNNNQRVNDNLTASGDYLNRMYNNLLQRQSMLEAERQHLQQQRSSWSQIETAEGENRQRIEQQYQQLQEKSSRLNSEIQYFNKINDQFNLQINAHNQNIERYNLNVTLAKHRFPPREFHKGIFMGKEIQIYQFESKDDLRLTIAHELGHALGLSHHSDAKALMYPMLGEQNLQHFQLQPSDIALLASR
ncbi:matrixin family metalloprotease [Acinetobacter tianfuensis]|uniref:Peptidase metallopeptidase domain-containing protein n=1 Tax=Acinetobacter tianfuensis TaxID=2419603 RepID=A0A3A8E6L8_9GAMM|nr:matrixin family metalloprotease [Acinetobacter tianfuensis]RKG30265.1 hypothetical protein D7V32_11955 [Acinetobacter tianfuensis]